MHSSVLTQIQLRYPELRLPELYSEIFEVQPIIPRATSSPVKIVGPGCQLDTPVNTTSASETSTVSDSSVSHHESSLGPKSPISSQDSVNTSGNETGSGNSSLQEINQNFLNLIGQSGYTQEGPFNFTDHGTLAAVANQMAQNYQTIQSEQLNGINYNQSEKDAPDYASTSTDSGNTRFKLV